MAPVPEKHGAFLCPAMTRDDIRCNRSSGLFIKYLSIIYSPSNIFMYHFLNVSTMKKRVVFLAALLLSVLGAFAQGNGSAGITEATNMVTSYFEPATKLIYAIGAVVGLIGGVKVYGKFSSGDPDTSKTAASWFGACIFLIVAATILRSFFLT